MTKYSVTQSAVMQLFSQVRSTFQAKHTESRSHAMKSPG